MILTTLVSTFFAGFVGGLLALLMPCIFPMLPLTVGFFTKRYNDRGKGIRDALFYGLSIIVIYVGFGLIITMLFGASALNSLATNGIFNIGFFVLLVIFAASLLGGLELNLPNRWVNRTEAGTNKKGFGGILMMALVLALVSFSCTGPIIGTLLVQAAANGARLAPAIGMLGFSIALAMPFVLFALFPAWLNRLPKSGAWMQTLKVTLGFLELGFSLKFLSNVDLAYHWHIIDREVFLSLWILIAGCLTIYLLGKLHLINDDSQSGITVPRLFSSILIGAFTLYMIPGLWGAPLKSISAFLPPMESQDFVINNNTVVIKDEQFPDVRHKDLFHAPLNLNAFFDFSEGLAYAKKVHKPVLVDFTGHACVNCRKMESTVWPDPGVLPIIRDQYVLIQLYVDDKTPVGNTTIGKINSDLQANKFNSNSQPDYVLLDINGNELITPQGAEYDTAEFAAYLRKGLLSFATR